MKVGANAGRPAPATRTLTPEAVDRVLRRAGHPRHDQRAGLRPSIGYVTAWGNGDEVIVTWDGGHVEDRARDQAALAGLMPALTAAGYRASEGMQGLDVEGEKVRWPVLILARRERGTAGEDGDLCQ